MARGNRKYGRDMQCSNTMLQISVYFDADTFNEINRYAEKMKKSFGALVRELVEFGLLDMKTLEKKR